MRSGGDIYNFRNCISNFLSGFVGVACRRGLLRSRLIGVKSNVNFVGREVGEAQIGKMTDQLGFHNLPFLAHRKSVKRGFEFTLMVVGEPP